MPDPSANAGNPIENGSCSFVVAAWLRQAFSAAVLFATGTKLLIVVLFLELTARPLLNLEAVRLGLNGQIWWMGVKIFVLISIACLLTKFFARCRSRT